MTRSSWFTLAYALMLGAAGPLAACAGNSTDGTTAASRQAPLEESNLDESSAAQASMASPYSDAQIQSFVAARTEIQALTPGQTAEAQTANQQRIGEILRSNNLAPDIYNAIEIAARTDQALANRVAAAGVSGATFTDAQLQAFVAASAQIDPLNRQIATATPEQRTQIGAQIRAALSQHNLDLDMYNGIAARAQTDQALGQRIAQLRAAQPAPPPAG